MINGLSHQERVDITTRKEHIMFKFFRSKKEQALTSIPNDNSGIYELNDDEVEKLIGGAPIRHLLVHPSSKNGLSVVPGQQFNHLNPAGFQEAFTLQPSQLGGHWSEQGTRGPSKGLNDTGN
jgi:hypothetical protein